MKKIISLLISMSFSICFAQSFTLQELENYSKLNFSDFSLKVLEKGYEYMKVDENVAARGLLFANKKNKNGIVFFGDNDGVLYITTSKTSYMNLVNSIKKQKYKSNESALEKLEELDKELCDIYLNNNNQTIATCKDYSFENDGARAIFFRIYVFEDVQKNKILELLDN